MLPNLFVIGAAKSGTTSLHHYLNHHPDIFMSPVKEPNFFAFEGRRPEFAGPSLQSAATFQRDRLRRERYQYSVISPSDYERLFAQAGGRKIRGESSPAYLYFPGVARRIAAGVPDARIVAVLREPVDRAYSKYRQMRRDNAEPIADFGAAVRLEEHRKQEGWSPAWLYLDRGFYHRQLREYYDTFPASRIHVLLHEDLCRNPKRVLRDIFRFLGVDPGVVVDVRTRHNVAANPQIPRAAWLYDLVLRPFLLSPHLQSALPEQAVARVRPWARRLLLRRAAPEQPAQLAPELRTMLTARFREDVEQLQHLIGRDLSRWLGPCRAADRRVCRFAGEGRMVGVGGWVEADGLGRTGGSACARESA
jgi:hypothetical protein